MNERNLVELLREYNVKPEQVKEQPYSQLGQMLTLDERIEFWIKAQQTYERLEKRLHPVYGEAHGHNPKLPRLFRHHSTADWDFSAVTWALDATIYVSAPSSLTATDRIYILCKYAGTTAINEGRIINQCRYEDIGYGIPFFLCRNQHAVGGADHNDCYEVRYYDNEWQVRRYVASVLTTIDTKAYTGAFSFSINTWYKNRLTFWESAGVFITRAERWSDPSWVTLSTDITDAVNQFSGSATNRVGYSMRSGEWIDDSEIWA